MAHSAQHRSRISRIRLGTASGVMALAVGLVLGLIAIQSLQAQTFTVLHNFTDPPDGADPWAGLVRDAAGNLYGTTPTGGALQHGTVFKVGISGNETVLYSFTGRDDGEIPYGSLIVDDMGHLYGTASQGGSFRGGTVFKMDTSGTETVLYSFGKRYRDGCIPTGGLIRDANGIFYGTTEDCGFSTYGTIFRVNQAGKETVLHSFNSSDGTYPSLTSLLLDKEGNFYGVTQWGGDLNCNSPNGCGTVYKLSKRGRLTVLHRFTGGTTDGCYAFGTLAMDKEGNVYGTAEECGSGNEGIVWKIDKKGTETVLHNFAGGPSDGAYTFAGVILDKKGNLYGDTVEGGGTGCSGGLGCGTVYKLSKTGALTLLHSFAWPNGAYPLGSLLRDTKGNIYGTTSQGGSNNIGTVWKLTP